MTLDRTKKYKVGDVVFEWADASKAWIDDTALLLKEMDLARFNPVEVEDPIKWGFESDGDFPGDVINSAPVTFAKGNWRHEVVSTRIG